MNPTGYPDHGSPMRRARELARRCLPCETCGSRKEPLLRRPRYLSAGWRRDPNAYFACAGCSARLQAITGAAGMRESEVAGDRVPDPQGAVTGCDLADRIESFAWTNGAMPTADWLIEAVRDGVGGASPSVSSRIEGSMVSFSHLGSPWMKIEVLRADRRKTGPDDTVDPSRAAFELSVVAGVRNVEALFLIAFAPAEDFRGSDSDPVRKLPAGTRLIRVEEVSTNGEPWQARFYRVAQPLPSRH